MKLQIFKTEILFLLLVSSCSRLTDTTATPSIVINSNENNVHLDTKVFFPTPTPTKISLPNKIIFPEWIKQSNSNILIDNERDNNAIILRMYGDDPSSYYNSIPKPFKYSEDDPELFQLPIPFDTYGYFWLDGSNLCLFNSSRDSVAEINIRTGEITNFSLKESSIQLLQYNDFNNPPYALIASSNKLDDNIILNYAANRNDISYDWKYKAFIGYANNNSNVFIQDLQTGNKINILTSYKAVSFEWPHNDSNKILLLQGDCGEVCEWDQIEVDNLSNNQIIMTKQLAYPYYAQWSWDDNSIIYSGIHGTPCFYNIITKNGICYLQYLPPINESNLYNYYNLQTMDAENISYSLYITGYVPQISHIPQSSDLGKYCIFNIITKKNYCPIEGLDTESEVPGEYLISPDNKIAVIQIGEHPFESGYSLISKYIMITIDHSEEYPNFRILDESSKEMNELGYLWRPL